MKLTVANLIKIIKATIPLIIVVFVVLYIVTSDVSINYLTRNMARATKTITSNFKNQGMNKVNVQGQINSGLISFTVKAEDEKN